MSLKKRNVVRLWLAASVAGLLVATGRLTAQLAADDLSEPIPPPAVLTGGEHVGSIRLLTIPRATSGRVESVIACDQGVYLAGRWWNQEEKLNLWLWRIDDSGEKLWDKHLAHQKRNEELTIVGLLPGARELTEGDPVPGVRVVYRQGLETKLAFFKADGEPILEQKIEGLESSHGLVADDEDKVFLFGRSMIVSGQPIHAWVARVTRLGAVLWKHTFRAERVRADDALEKADEAEAVPAGSLQATFLLDGTFLEDGSLVLIGQTGVYNKFGQGPSQLWLLRIDRDGRRLAEAFIDEGRLFPSGRDLIANCDGGVVALYTTAQLPPISSVPLNVPPGFGIRLARFNAELEKLWDTRLSSTGMPGAATIIGPDPFVSLTASPGELLIRGSSDAGDELWNARVATPESFVTPLGALRSGDDVISVCNYRAYRSRDPDRMQKVLLIHVSPPRQ